MPDNSADTQPTMTYPTEDQHARWKKEAEQIDMTLSEFIQNMTEAGLKKFDVEISSDESLDKVRRQRNDLKAELDRTRNRVSELEKQLHQGERAAIKNFVDENPGAELDEIVQHILETTSERVAKQLEDMVAVGDLHYDEGEYYT